MQHGDGEGLQVDSEFELAVAECPCICFKVAIVLWTEASFATLIYNASCKPGPADWQVVKVWANVCTLLPHGEVTTEDDIQRLQVLRLTYCAVTKVMTVSLW
jgi:hypothetical protein